LLLFLAGVLLVVLGALAAWLTFIRPHRQVYFGPLAVGEYGEEFPVRRWVRQDRDALAGLPWRSQESFTRQKRELIEEHLSRLTSRPTDDSVVFYLSAYAQARDNGELCILPVDARIDQPETWMPLRRVFEGLRKCPARRKLLLIDVTQPFTDPRRGILINDAAERLEPFLQEMLDLDPALGVLSACSPGQVSLTSEELGQSVFAYHVCRALSGNAGATKNDRVSVKELTARVVEEVDRWVARHRGTRQTPRWYGAKLDFDLARLEPGGGAQPAPLASAYPASLKKGWELRDGWWKDETYRRAPSAFRQVEAALLRAEQEWRGGIDLDAVEVDLRARVQKAERLRSRALPGGEPGPARSVALAASRLKAPLPGGGRHPLLDDLRRLLVLQGRAAAPKADPALAQQLEKETGGWLEKLAGKPLELAWVVLELASEDRLTASGLRFAVGLLQKGKAPSWAETRRLGKLADLPAPEQASDWPGEGVRQATWCIRAEEQAATFEEADRGWVRASLAKAKQLHRQGETLLASKRRKERESAAGVLEKALQAYETAVRDMEQAREARQANDEAAMLLPSYAGYLEVDERQGEVWRQAVSRACELRKALLEAPAANPMEAAKQVEKMADLANDLRKGANALGKLREPLEGDALRGLIRRSTRGNPTDLNTIRAWLRTPWPTTKERLELWAAWRAGSAAVYGRPPAPAPPARESQAAVRDEQRRALGRAQWSVELLRMLGRTDQDKVEALARLAEDTRNLRSLSVALRDAWAPLLRSDLEE
jgi:hypothetical protein